MSTIKVTNIQHASASTAAIALNSDGQATLNGLNFPSAGPLSNRNLIINGAMQVAQRGTSSTASDYGSVDRFKPYFVQVSATHSQESLSSGSPYDEGFRSFLRMSNTSTSSSTASQAEIQYRVEAQDLAKSGWNYTSSTSHATCSFWARSSLAGTYYVAYRDRDAGTLRYNASFTLTADTWTKVTHTIPGNSNVVFNNDTGEGLRITFTLHYGTDNTGSDAQLDAWHNTVGNDYYPDFAQNWSNTASATFDITGVQLEVGSVATPFEHRSYGDELQRCLRYFQYYATDTASAVYLGMGIASGSTSARMFMPISVAMRTTPSITENGASADDQIDSTYALSSPSVIGSTASTVRVQFTASGMTGGRPLQLQVGTGESITLSAEL